MLLTLTCLPTAGGWRLLLAAPVKWNFGRSRSRMGAKRFWGPMNYLARCRIGHTTVRGWSIIAAASSILRAPGLRAVWSLRRLAAALNRRSLLCARNPSSHGIGPAMGNGYSEDRG